MLFFKYVRKLLPIIENKPLVKLVVIWSRYPWYHSLLKHDIYLYKVIKICGLKFDFDYINLQVWCNSSQAF